MYGQERFKETRIPVLHEAIGAIAFGSLVTSGSAGLEASHVPMLVDDEPKPLGSLRGHLARANPQWSNVEPGTEALALFVGPNSYVTPSWYPTKQETEKVVPTWNYIAVQARGTLTFVDDPTHALAHLEDLTAQMEHGQAQPWAVSDAPEDFTAAMSRGIVGFELAITHLEGVWKLSQNRPAADIEGVRRGLAERGDDAGAALAREMGDV